MKRFLLFVAMLFISLGIFAQYVDLGLPSGTLWYAKNEGGDYARYTYNEAIRKFGNKLPTKEQLEELINKCTRTWGTQNGIDGYTVTGPNGNSIFFPAAGVRHCGGSVGSGAGEYWASSTHPGAGYAYQLFFHSNIFYWTSGECCKGISVRLVAQKKSKYVDLGLPSGTLWKDTNEGGENIYYTYNEAVSKFANKLPTKEQLMELKNQCTWTWTGSGYKVVGPNGNSIYFPAAGRRGCYGGVYDVGSYGDCWSSTPDGSDLAYGFDFDSGGVGMFSNLRCIGRSVRLVAQKKSKYVDLGLPSGTLWKDTNEGGENIYYTYNEAVSKFANKLPTKEQLMELKNQCTWTWTGSGYKVVGPNGNSIYLPAAGRRDCNGGVDDVGSDVYYWSSTPGGSDYAYYFYCYSGIAYISYNYHCFGFSVRLVQN